MTAPLIDHVRAAVATAPSCRVEESAVGPVVVVDGRHGAGRVALYGGQLLEWTPRGGRPVVWCSPRAVYAPGKAIRGGAPVCFPWFGPRRTEDVAPPGATSPQHGFARTTPWALVDVREDGDGVVDVALRLASDGATRATWPHDFAATVHVGFAEELTLSLTIENTGTAPFSCEAALHTYFAVDDVARVRLRGLERARYRDKTRAGAEDVGPDAPLPIDGEVDRVYVGHEGAVAIEDGDREIVVAKRGSRSTVVWNIGGPTLADVGDAWRSYVCVEAGCIAPDDVRLAPGASHELATTIRATPRARTTDIDVTGP